MSNDLISRSVAIDEFYKRVGGDLTIEDIKYIEKVLEEVPTACHVDMIIDKMEEIIQKYRAIGTPEECREAVEAARSHSNDGWIPCSDGMPENEKEVEITYMWEACQSGKAYYDTARAFYTDGTMTTEDSGYNWEDTDDWEYCEEKDAAYIPEGWWECVAFCENFSAVDQKVIAWRHCPEPYRLQKSVGEDYKQRVMERFMKME